MKIVIRKVVEDDHAFIYSTYLKNRWYDKANKTTLKHSTWCHLQHNRLEEILTKGHVHVACLDEEPSTIVGYGFIDGKSPFTYVKLDWRKASLGISDRILKELV